MKKFIMSRSETTTGGPSTPGDSVPPAPNISNMEIYHMLRSDWQSEVNPPLPLDPPPPDIPLQVKQEVVDNDYVDTTQEHQEQQEHQETTTELKTEPTTSIICRDFIRGTCKREGTCKYAHKHDLSQLEGVYTFCRKFQNSVCTFTNCKYVHATVFEEQHFYRTGELPAHALQHKTNNNNMLQPPPPPPPPPPEEPTALPFNVDFSNPPPPLPQTRLEIEKQQMITCVPTCTLEARSFMGDGNNAGPPPNNVSPLKCNWSNPETFGQRPADIGFNEQTTSATSNMYNEPQQCKHCDTTKFRLEHKRNKLKKMIQNRSEMKKKTAALDRHAEKIRGLIAELLKPMVSPKTQAQPHTNGHSGDKETTIMEHIVNSFLGVNRMTTRENK